MSTRDHVRTQKRRMIHLQLLTRFIYEGFAAQTAARKGHEHIFKVRLAVGLFGWQRRRIAPDQSLRVSTGDQLAMIQYAYLVAQFLRFFHIVGREQNSTPVRLQLTDQRPDSPP